MSRFALLLSLVALGLIACDDDDETATAETEVITSDFVPASDIVAVRRDANKWAWLFGASGTCNRYMSQPGCERVACQRVGAKKPIPNCTPLSRADRRSFRGATAESIVIKGDRAAVSFTNDKVVEFDGAEGFPWVVRRVGGNAGRGFGLRE